MDSSRSRNSILDWLIAVSLALAAIVAVAGVDARIGTLSLRAHSPWRILIVAAMLLAVRWRFGFESRVQWVTRIVLLTAISASIFTWFRFMVGTVGGADSYGYVSASQAIASGRLIESAPVADLMTAPNRMALASPLGWTPSPDAEGIAPTFPIGVSMVMALFSLVAGQSAVFFVAPVMGVITLLLVYRLAREWFDEPTSLFATALVAWNPLMIAYAKQPMSDVPAAMWITLALWLAVRSGHASALLSGLAAGAAVMTRPALLIAAAVIPIAAHRAESPKRRLLLSAAGLAIGVLAQMAIQHQLFGSPFSTGYGSTSSLFSFTNVDDNLGIFGRHGWSVLGPLFVPGLILGLFASRPEPRNKPVAVFVAVLLPYLFYLPFDHWETLRFLLPGIVPLTVVVSEGLIHVARYPRRPIATALITIGFMALVAGMSENLLRKSSVWDVAALEARYPLAGEWVSVNTPPEAIVLANQHSGSLRWYGKRQTIRWDYLEPQQLVPMVQELQARGATVYVALEGSEVEMFDARFAGVINQLQVDHVGRVRNVSFRRLVYFPPNK